jgi:hypothetical protein
MMSEKIPPSELKVAILGGGPSAAFAAVACRDLKVGKIDIYAHQRVAAPAGSFYLHKIPHTLPDKDGQFLVSFGIGNRGKYVENQYNGELPNHTPSSFPNETRVNQVWNYDQIRDIMFLGATWQDPVFYKSDEEIIDLLSFYDVIFHTFPSYKSRKHKHPPSEFPVATYTLRSPIMRGQWPDFCRVAEIIPQDLANWSAKVIALGYPPVWPDCANWVVYNGSRDYSWVRFSYLWGQAHIEYPVGYHISHPQIEVFEQHQGKVSIQRNLYPDEEPWDEQIAEDVYPIGRFATWNPETLSHDTYWKASGILKNYITGG